MESDQEFESEPDAVEIIGQPDYRRLGDVAV